jgi:hypothetical protein
MINYIDVGLIELIPKCSNMELVERYIPSTLLIVFYKVLTRILANRVKLVVSITIRQE